MLGIIIVTYNTLVDIFLLQIDAINKFCKDDYRIEIIDNSHDLEKAEGIRYHSERLGLSYRKTFSRDSNGSDSHSFAANLSYNILKDTYDYLFYLDHDCIPIKPFSVSTILGDKLMAGIAQNVEHTYFWAGCFLFNNRKIEKDLLDFRPDNTLGLDTGGSLYKLIEHHTKESCLFFHEAYHQNPYFNGRLYNYYSIINEQFLHFINSSNWNGTENHTERINSLITVTKEIIQKNDNL